MPGNELKHEVTPLSKHSISREHGHVSANSLYVFRLFSLEHRVNVSHGRIAWTSRACSMSVITTFVSGAAASSFVQQLSSVRRRYSGPHTVSVDHSVSTPPATRLPHGCCWAREARELPQHPTGSTTSVRPTIRKICIFRSMESPEWRSFEEFWNALSIYMWYKCRNSSVQAIRPRGQPRPSRRVMQISST